MPDPSMTTAEQLLDLVERVLDPDQANYRSHEAAGRVLGVLHMRHLNGDAWAVQRLQELRTEAPPGQHREASVMSKHVTIDLDDTLRCALALGCEVCGRAGGCHVYTAATSVGVYCLTLCERCGEMYAAAGLPGMVPIEAAERVWEHCEHPGIDLDQMAELLNMEREATKAREADAEEALQLEREVAKHRADPDKGAAGLPPIGNATAFGFGLPSTNGERS
jgi:hypothetical protein